MKTTLLKLSFIFLFATSLQAATFENGNFVGEVEGTSKKCKLVLMEVRYNGGYATYGHHEYQLVKAYSSSAANCPMFGEDHTRYVGFELNEQGREIEICVSNEDNTIGQVVYQRIKESILLEEEICLNIR